jgi:ABC-type transport system involved in multi-copper enzyme maturation permease subunit
MTSGVTRVISTIARTTLLEAVRSRMLWLVGCLLVLAFGLAGFLQQVAIIETAPIQAAIIAALLRACAAFLTAAFVVISMVREANDKVLELMLAQPWPRAAYLLGKFVGFSTAAVGLALAFSLPLLPFAPAAGVAAWALSLACELAIVAAMSLFFVLTLTHVVPALAAVLGFYVLARSIAAIQIVAGAAEASVAWTDRLAGWIVQGIGFLLPRLDLMTQTAWLVEAAPTPAAIAGVVLQAAVYSLLLVAGAQFDLQRQNL